jgi:hypothetical protein
MKWKKEVHQTQREALVSDLYADLSFWRQRRVALGIHPAKPHAIALVGIEDAITSALSALGEDMTPHPEPNPQAGKEVNLPVWFGDTDEKAR